jgi:hypothetical protein
MIKKLVSLGLLSVIALMIVIGLNIESVHSQSIHRGRIQAQGDSPPIEVSQAWTQATPLSAADGLMKLDALWNSLTTSQKKERAQAYSKAKTFIQNAAQSGGVTAVTKISKTFNDPQRKDPSARIDIEIITGTAFTPQISS